MKMMQREREKKIEENKKDTEIEIIMKEFSQSRSANGLNIKRDENVT
jgi:hypothetical protein